MDLGFILQGFGIRARGTGFWCFSLGLAASGFIVLILSNPAFDAKSQAGRRPDALIQKPASRQAVVWTSTD